MTFFEAAAAQLVHHQRQQDAAGKFGQQTVDAHSQRISDDAHRIGAVQEPHEVLQHVDLPAFAGPRTAPDPQNRLEILKSDLNARHGPITKQQKVNDTRQHQQIQLPVVAELAHDAFRQFLLRVLDVICSHVFKNPFRLFPMHRRDRNLLPAPRIG
ncbi:MAG: hypothetical protein ACLUE8_13955 [Lachnospiraceae bacterium]